MLFMEFTTINQLVGNIRGKINQLNGILDVLLSNYRSASEMINTEIDYRQTYLEQLLELNQTLTEIVDVHPAAIGADKIWQNATDVITAIAMSGDDIKGTSDKYHEFNHLVK